MTEQQSKAYHGDPHVDGAVCEEPVEESSLGWHHMRILLCLLLFLTHAEDSIGVLLADGLLVGQVARLEDDANERAHVDGLCEGRHFGQV